MHSIVGVVVFSVLYNAVSAVQCVSSQIIIVFVIFVLFYNTIIQQLSKCLYASVYYKRKKQFSCPIKLYTKYRSMSTFVDLTFYSGKFCVLLPIYRHYGVCGEEKHEEKWKTNTYTHAWVYTHVHIKAWQVRARWRLQREWFLLLCGNEIGCVWFIYKCVRIVWQCAWIRWCDASSAVVGYLIRADARVRSSRSYLCVKYVQIAVLFSAF